jgi:hypothetical protein
MRMSVNRYKGNRTNNHPTNATGAGNGGSKAEQEKFVVGEVRMCSQNCGGTTESFYAVITGIRGEAVRARRLYNHDYSDSRYPVKDLIKDKEHKNLEYPMFVDPRNIELPRSAVGEKIGKLSRYDLNRMWL